MADETRDLKIVISSDTSEAEKGLGGFGESLGHIGEIAAGLGLEKITEQIISFGKSLVTDSLKAFQTHQDAVARLDSALKATGGTSGVTRDQILDLASSLEKTTHINDDAILSIDDLLLHFDKIGKDVLPNATKEIIAVSRGMNIDATTAAKQLGKALQDPATALNSLSRLGVKFTKDQEEMVKQMVASNDTAGAQNFILDTLKKRFGDGSDGIGAMSAAQADLNNSLDHLKRTIGEIIANFISPYVEKLSQVVSTITDLITGHTHVSDIIEKIKTQFPQLSGIIDGVIDTFKKISPQLQAIWNDVKDIITTTMEIIGIIVGQALEGIRQFWQQHGDQVIFILRVAFTTLADVLKLGLDVLSGSLKIFRDIFKGDWSQLWNDVKAIFTQVFEDIKKIFTDFEGFAGNIINGIKSKISDTVSKLTGLGNGSGGGGARALGGVASGLTLVGENGPELVSLPTGSYVHNNQETQGMLGGTTVNIYNPSVRNDNDITEIVSQVKRALGRETELASLAGI